MQIQKQTVDGIQVSFPSKLCEVNQACDLLQGFLDKRKNVSDLFLILLALREAFTNAVIHGNKKNTELLVSAIVEIHDDQLVAVIRDQGPGFAWRSHTWELPNPKSESGRGLAIIQSCFENIEFNTSGNEITLRKQLGNYSANSNRTRGWSGLP
ncbi:serine/threonine-protein kinase RsbW [Desulfonatronum thiosulfatophilum]|uniref:Serine/threonine-protein kinase RsbW n=1 Tax=Desulfonatronum thiosulfatophilum TaxID=617002 RepID=A0A1G6DCL1_9BACT|nr:ATP-binding protein [Desulfonatronum thiosulfatophilum]SDB42861.1 serine/threonine-protein kinase RsbW [Desulfonatronum thiosulfatophilum]